MKRGKMLNILLVVSLVSGSLATVDFKDQCPDVSPINNFNFSAFADGVWYEIARYPNVFEGRGDCATLQFTPGHNRTNFEIADVTDKKRIFFYGHLEFSPETNNAGIVIFHSKMFVDEEGSEEILVNILDTDYDNYVISYDCQYDKQTKKIHDYAWIASRSKNLNKHFQTIVDNFLETSVIDRNKLIWDRFTEESCRY